MTAASRSPSTAIASDEAAAAGICILQNRRNDACRGNQDGGPDVVAPVATPAVKRLSLQNMTL